MKSDVSSSNNMKARRKKEFNESWDRVEFYLKKQKALREKKVSDKDSQTKETVGISCFSMSKIFLKQEKKMLEVLEKILHVLTTGSSLDCFNGKRLLQIFLLSNLVLGIQLAVSKK